MSWISQTALIVLFQQILSYLIWLNNQYFLLKCLANLTKILITNVDYSKKFFRIFYIVYNKF